ncbi:MAG: OmpA family protein [Gammaproteobacteria bacterium]|nr:OmpA family protein [Gammaproteobacteria bacterium]MDH3466469.1 OmpA family protein [Gammaproteobacteria bacterium]
MGKTITILLSGLLLVACATTNEKLIDELKSYGLESRETDRGVVVILPDVFFEFDKYDLTLDARTRLQNASQTLNSTLAQSREIAIEGYTDSVGTEEYNVKLSEKRAETVQRELLFSNVSKGRTRAKGFGESNPIAPNTNADGSDNPEGRAKNRRVELIILNPSEQ